MQDDLKQLTFWTSSSSARRIMITSLQSISSTAVLPEIFVMPGSDTVSVSKSVWEPYPLTGSLLKTHPICFCLSAVVHELYSTRTYSEDWHNFSASATFQTTQKQTRNMWFQFLFVLQLNWKDKCQVSSKWGKQLSMQCRKRKTVTSHFQTASIGDLTHNSIIGEITDMKFDTVSCTLT